MCTQPRVHGHRVHNHGVYNPITTTALWISPLIGYFVPAAIALGLFLNIPLILTASALLHMFTASIGGRRRSRHDSGCSSLYSLRSGLYSLRSSLYSFCSNLYSLRSNLYSLRSLRSSLRNSLRATALVVTSLAGLKLARSAVK